LAIILYANHSVGIGERAIRRNRVIVWTQILSGLKYDVHG